MEGFLVAMLFILSTSRQVRIQRYGAPPGFTQLVQNRAMNKVRITLSLLLALCALQSQAQQEEPQLNLPRTELTAGIYRISAQVAVTQEQQATGLMYRREMPQAEGMLFVFRKPSKLCFWMKNTVLPLTAAFIADNGTLVNMEDMEPQTTNSHCSLKPVRYVLEMNQGWFAKRGLRPGSRLGGAPFGG